MEDTVAAFFGGFMILLILLVIFAYYVGFTADIKQVGDTLNTLFLTASGRNSAGSFAAYPTAPAA